MKWFAPGSRGVNVWRLTGDVITESDPAGPAVTVWHGGHEHYVTTAERTLLIAAGYAANITEVADPVFAPGIPGNVYSEGVSDVTDTGLWTYGADLYGGGFYGGFAVSGVS